MPSSIPDYFALFGLEPRFALDQDLLSRAYRGVLAQVHPDRHVGAGAAERRAAMQLASHANQAFQVLKSEASRAAYLCQCRDVLVDGPGAAPLARAFLEQQMQWREILEEARAARDAPAVAALARTVAAERAQCIARLAVLLDEQQDFPAAAAEVRALMFLDKMGAEMDRFDADRADAMATGR